MLASLLLVQWCLNSSLFTPALLRMSGMTGMQGFNLRGAGFWHCASEKREELVMSRLFIFSIIIIIIIINEYYYSVMESKMTKGH